MAIRTEHEIWRAELAGERRSFRGHLIAIVVGVALAALLIAAERVW